MDYLDPDLLERVGRILFLGPRGNSGEPRHEPLAGFRVHDLSLCQRRQERFPELTERKASVVFGSLVCLLNT